MCNNISISSLSIFDGQFGKAVLTVDGKAVALHVEFEPFTNLGVVQIDSAKWSDGTEAASFVAGHRNEIAKMLIDGFEKAVAPA